MQKHRNDCDSNQLERFCIVNTRVAYRKSFSSRYRKQQKSVPLYFDKSEFPSIVIRTTANNLFVTIVSALGNVIGSLSCGKVGYRGPRKASNIAAETLGRFLISVIMKKNIRLMRIILRTRYARLVYKAMKSFRRFRLRYYRIYELLERIPKAHNGIRKPKLRRT